MPITLLGVSIAESTTTITMPWAETPQAGDIGILVRQHRNDVFALSGWTNLSYIDITDDALRAEYKICSGGEASVSFTPTLSRRMSCALYHIRGATAVEVIHSNSAMSNTGPDFPDSSPSWGAKETLWIINGGSYFTGANYSLTAPSGYTRVMPTVSSPNSFGSAHRLLNASSENPAKWTVSTLVQTVGIFLAVRPSEAAVSSRRRRSSMQTGGHL